MSDEPTLADRGEQLLTGRAEIGRRGIITRWVRWVREAVEALREKDARIAELEARCRSEYERGWQNGLAYGETRRHR